MVQRVVAGDEDDQRLLLRPPRPAGLLPQRRQRAGVAGQHDRVQPGDVDAELQRVGRRHAQQVAGRQRPLQLAALLGQVAAAVGVHPADEVVAAAVVQQPAGLLGDRLRAAPRPDERQRPRAALDEVGQQPRGVRGGRAAQRCPVLAGALGQRRLPQREGRAGTRGAVVGDRLDGRTHQAGRGRGRLGDGGRGQHEHRLRAVAPADPPQPAQHVPDVRAEHPAVGVALVDDDVGDPAQGARPLLVRRQDPAVEHVRVGDDPPRVPPHPVALLAGGVPVVGGRAHRRVGERRHRRQLVAGQGLRRRQVEHAGAGVLGQPGQRRQLVGQRLPRRRPRRDDDVPAVARQLRRVDLVPPRRAARRAPPAARAAAGSPTPARPGCCSPAPGRGGRG